MALRLAFRRICWASSLGQRSASTCLCALSKHSLRRFFLSGQIQATSESISVMLPHSQGEINKRPAASPMRRLEETLGQLLRRRQAEIEPLRARVAAIEPRQAIEERLARLERTAGMPTDAMAKFERGQPLTTTEYLDWVARLLRLGLGNRGTLPGGATVAADDAPDRESHSRRCSMARRCDRA